MQCLECDGKTLVYRSKKVYGTVVRFRLCDTCGHKFVTEELEVTDPQMLKTYTRAANKRGDR